MIFKGLIFLGIFLPFFPAFDFFPGFDLNLARIFIPALFLAWLAASLKNKEIRIEKSALTLSLLGFLFLALFSLFFSEKIEWSIRKALYFLSLVPFYFVFSSGFTYLKKSEKIVRSFVFGGLLAAILGIIQFSSQFIFGLEATKKFWIYNIIPFFLGENLSHSVSEHMSWFVNISGIDFFRAISAFPDPHMFSMYLGLIFPLALGLYFKNKKSKWLWGAVIILIADILTFSRGAYAGIIFGFGFSFLFFYKKIDKKTKSVAWALAILIFSAFLFPNPISSRFFSSLNFSEGSNRGRLEMWEKAGEEILKSPLFGVGIGNFPLKVDPLAEYRDPIYAHNTYLDIAVEMGIPAAVFWMIFLFLSFKKIKNSSSENPFFVGPAISLLVFSVHSFFDTGIYSPPVFLTLLFVVSLNLSDWKK